MVGQARAECCYSGWPPPRTGGLPPPLRPRVATPGGNRLDLDVWTRTYERPWGGGLGLGLDKRCQLCKSWENGLSPVLRGV